MKKYFLLLLTVVGLLGCQQKPSQETEQPSVLDENKHTLFIGTYTLKEGHVDGKGEGIYVYQMDKETGELTYVNTSEEIISPSYLTVHPNGQWVYAVNEFNGGEEEFAAVTALSFDPVTADLRYETQATTLGQYPCHVSLDNSGNFVMVANYVGGSLAVFPIDEEGLITESSSYVKHKGGSDHPRQEAAHRDHNLQSRAPDRFGTAQRVPSTDPRGSLCKCGACRPSRDRPHRARSGTPNRTPRSAGCVR